MDSNSKADILTYPIFNDFSRYFGIHEDIFCMFTTFTIPKTPPPKNFLDLQLPILQFDPGRIFFILEAL